MGGEGGGAEGIKKDILFFLCKRVKNGIKLL